MIPLATAERAWPYHGRYPRRCRVVARRRPVAGRVGLALAAGQYVAAGTRPHLCRPAAVYLVESAGRASVQVRVVYSPGGCMVGRRFWWGRDRLEAAWRLGDVRVVARWQAPTETLVASRDRRLDPRGAVPATGQAAIAAGG